MLWCHLWSVIQYTHMEKCSLFVKFSTLYFFMKFSTFGNPSFWTCLKAALYCTSNLEHAAVYLKRNTRLHCNVTSSCLIHSWVLSLKCMWPQTHNLSIRLKNTRHVYGHPRKLNHAFRYFTNFVINQISSNNLCDNQLSKNG